MNWNLSELAHLLVVSIDKLVRQMPQERGDSGTEVVSS
jgi:hypothetical protein